MARGDGDRYTPVIRRLRGQTDDASPASQLALAGVRVIVTSGHASSPYRCSSRRGSAASNSVTQVKLL